MALVPHLRSIFDLPYAWAMLAESAFFLAYFVFSSPTSKLIETIGYKKTMVVSLFIQVVGCLLFVPAAKLVSFPLFLTAVFIVGAGVTALQTAANPYVAILGPEHSAPVRLTLAQALNSLGGTIAPLVAGAYILTDPASLASKAAIADTVRGPYIAIAGGLLILGIAVAFMRLPHVAQTQTFRPAKEGDPILSRSIWGYRHTVLGAVGIFLYVGVEVGLASIAVNYFKTQGVDSVVPRVALLGRRAGRPPAGLMGAHQDQIEQAPRGLRLYCSRSARRLHGLKRPGGHLDRRALRLLQLHHVPQHLRLGHRRTRSDDQ
jgi:FHS family L-fucose permease-like MFS transporter